MALTNTNIPSAASDVVGVFDQDFEQVFPLARPIKCIVDETAKAMEHPTETGVVITDHIIFLPNEIELSMILPAGEYRSVYQQINQIYKAATILSVQTRATTYSQMFIYRMPHQEDPDLFDTISLSVRLREVQIFSTTTQALPAGSVANTTDQSTVKNGLQQAKPKRNLPPPDEIMGPADLRGAPGVNPDKGLATRTRYIDYIDDVGAAPIENLTDQQKQQIMDSVE